MAATMVFIHGRGQEFKDPAVLARTWQAGLAAGLTKAGRPQLAGVPVVFPFYANLLYQITAQVAQSRSSWRPCPQAPTSLGHSTPTSPQMSGPWNGNC
jgi:hypothetical protein